jgi:hypothetical protein
MACQILSSFSSSPQLHGGEGRGPVSPSAPFTFRLAFDLFGAFAAPQHDHAQEN